MIVIGITGQTGAGKTTTLREITALGGVTIDCDAVYHRLLDESHQLRWALEARFGNLSMNDGTFNRKALGVIVFRDAEALDDLNQISHRHVVCAVKSLIAKAEENNVPVVGIDAIGLLESGLDQICQTTLAITAPAELRIERIMKRENLTHAYAKSRVCAQQAEQFFTERCEYVVKNDTDNQAEFQTQVNQLLVEILDQYAS